MLKFPHIVACSLLVLTAPFLPAFGDEVIPSRTPWKVVDPGSEKVVRWVVEGCAAYPVTEATTLKQSVADIAPQTRTGPADETKHPIRDNE